MGEAAKSCLQYAAKAHMEIVQDESHFSHFQYHYSDCKDTDCRSKIGTKNTIGSLIKYASLCRLFAMRLQRIGKLTRLCVGGNCGVFSFAKGNLIVQVVSHLVRLIFHCLN